MNLLLAFCFAASVFAWPTNSSRATEGWSALPSGPTPRGCHTAVWTDSEMIVWGGQVGGLPCGSSSETTAVLGEGARYDPLTRHWLPLSPEGAPSPRTGHVAVWTGEEVLIWGGRDQSGWFVDGARYRPSTDSWSPMARAGGPQYANQAVWTGTEMVVLTRDDQIARYSPARDHWTPVSMDGLLESRESPRVGLGSFEPSMVWTGMDLVVWATDINSADPGTPFMPNGFVLLARYDMADDRWDRWSVDGAPTPRSHPVVAWTGDELIVWGGHPYGGRIVPARRDGGRYNPATDSWGPMSTGGAPVGSYDYGPSAWTGTELAIWGSYSAASGILPGGGLYEPATDAWRSFPQSVEPRPAYGDSMVWTGTSLLLFGNNGGWAYTPRAPESAESI